LIPDLLDILRYDEQSPLIFTKLYFWIFFAIVLLGYGILYKKRGIRNAYLFAISLFFYYKTSGFFFSILLFSTVTDFLIGFGIYHGRTVLMRKLWLSLSIVINLSVLVYFKYAYFFTDSFNMIFGAYLHPINHFAQVSNSFFGSTFRVDKILLPVGISFYTFQTMSYAIDIYRKKLKPVRNIFDFGFYVSFFPQLVAGPIVRAADFIPQLYKPYALSKRVFGLALFWIINGLLKKMLLADYLAVNFIDRIFDDPSRYTGLENLMALYGYSLQVYADFSGYTDIAIGIALLMGFRLPVNFNSPYKADSVGNFWKRWHISLSSWLKDYLYIPLGGNRGGTVGTWIALLSIILLVSALAGNLWIFVMALGAIVCLLAVAQFVPRFKNWLTTNINIMLTMLLGGLWHGASWNFVIWGGLNGLGIVVYKLWRKISPWENKNHWVKRAWAIFITFNFITFTRAWFRTGSHNTWENLNEKHDIQNELENGWAMVVKIFTQTDLSMAPQFFSEFSNVMWVMVAGYIIHWLPSRWKMWYRHQFIRTPYVVKILICFAVVFLLYQIMSADLQPFIYFQF
jgi:D-alanyl-lipoteichoic acid acyltransferase DltB (MBOAT superfamily)